MAALVLGRRAPQCRPGHLGARIGGNEQRWWIGASVTVPRPVKRVVSQAGCRRGAAADAGYVSHWMRAVVGAGTTRVSLCVLIETNAPGTKSLAGSREVSMRKGSAVEAEEKQNGEPRRPAAPPSSLEQTRHDFRDHSACNGGEYHVVLDAHPMVAMRRLTQR